MVHHPRSFVIALLALLVVPSAARTQELASRVEAAAVHAVIVGHVLDVQGAPVAGALVVSSAGGRAATDGAGAFRLEIAVPAGADAVRVTAVLGSGADVRMASADVDGLLRGGTTAAGPLVLAATAGCEPSWLPTFGAIDGTSNTVTALAVFDDGSGPALYVGGAFAWAGSTLVDHVAKWDGATWSPLGAGVDGDVNALVAFDDGGGPALYAGGSFEHAGGLTVNRVAKWDGSVWSPLGAGVNSTVRTLAVHDDGRGAALYAGGIFHFADGSPARGVAKWDGNAWSPLGGGLTSTDVLVFALASFDDGSGPALYVGGLFFSAEGSSTPHIARWNGASWSGVGSGMDDSVRVLGVFDLGDGPALYAGGSFEIAGGVPAPGIARWDGAWSGLGIGLFGALGAHVTALELFDGAGEPVLVVSGSFEQAGGLAADDFALWDGTTWSADPAGGLGSGAAALEVFDSGDGPHLVGGGGFTTAGGAPALHVAEWDGDEWFPLGGGVSGWVRALAVHDDGTGPALYVGGDFDRIADLSASRIAKWDGSAWSALAGGVNDRVWALEVFDDGGGDDLYVAGQFTAAGGIAAPGIARWSGPGAGWSAVGAFSTTDVYALEVFDDGSGEALFAGGFFTSVDGLPVGKVARWDGSSWSALGAGLGGSAFSQVSALQTYDDGSGEALYVGGDFDTAGGAAANNVARWDGAAWSPLGFGADNDVFALTVFDDGGGPELVAGGRFFGAGTKIVHNIAAWDGTAWRALGPGTSNDVLTLAVYDDGSGPGLYAGGAFAFTGGLQVRNIAHWDGLAWSHLGGGTNEDVLALAVFDRGDGPALYAGGAFRSAFDSKDSHLARWGGCTAPTSPWADLGGGASGSAGIPQLELSGPLTPMSTVDLDLVDGAPSALAVLFVSFSSTPAPFLGGTLHALPIGNLFLLATDAGGEIHGAASFSGAPSGLGVWFQIGILDASVPVFGASLSNGVKGTVP